MYASYIRFMPDSTQNDIFRPALLERFPVAGLIGGIFLAHLLIRFGGIWNVLFIPLSMVIIWPIPWLVSNRRARMNLGFKGPKSKAWFILGPLYALAALVVCIALVWLAFGSGDYNWMVQHALYLSEALSQAPSGSSKLTGFVIVTLPALIFSPFAEEFLYRGYMLSGFSQILGIRSALMIQAFAFALAHLAHYGLNPFQPLLIAIWFPSMFFAALVLGWITIKSESIWVAVLSHGFFNIGMNGLVFILLPDVLGV